jgi:cell division inhibitor SepF
MADQIKSKFKFFMGLDDVQEEESQENEFQVPEQELPTTYKTDEANHLFGSKKKQEVEKMLNPGSPSKEKIQVTISKPEDFNDSATVVNHLKENKPVIVNLEALDIETARKIFDFCSGALFALDGKIFKVSKNIFLFAPRNVDITGNLKNSLESDYDIE